MNKYIKAYSDIVCHALALHKSEVLTTEELSDRFKILEELIQKEEPMKPNITDNNAYCPKCREAFGKQSMMVNPDKWHAYCPICGQKIDWIDEK